MFFGGRRHGGGRCCACGRGGGGEGEFRAPERELLLSPATKVTRGRGWCVGRMGGYQIAPKPPRGRLWQVAADAAGYGGYRLRVEHLIRSLRGHLQLCTPPVCTPRALASQRALGCPQREG